MLETPQGGGGGGGGEGVHGSGEHFNPHFEYLRLNCQAYSQSEYQAGMLVGEGAVSMKHEAQGHGQFLNVLQTRQSDLNLVKIISKKMLRTKDVKESAIMSQGGTQTCDLANGLPCSNQLRDQVIQQLNA